MNQLCKLPGVAVLKIIEYLRIKDILNLRLTCSSFYSVCNGNLFFRKVIIKVKSTKIYELKLFRKLLEKHASYLALNLQHCDSTNLSLLLPYITNIAEIVVEIKYLPRICEICKDIQKLGIYLNPSKSLRYDNLYQMDDAEDLVGKINFECLSSLHNLDELKFHGHWPGRWHLKPTILWNILDSAKAITKISFIGEFVIFPQRKCVENQELRAMRAIQRFIESQNHVNEWHLQNIYNYEPKYTLMFPHSVKVLNYACCWKPSVRLFRACKDFLNLENLVNIEKLIIDNGIFTHLPAIIFPKLMKLVIKRGSIYNHLQMEASSTKVVFLPLLKHVRIIWVCGTGLEFYKPLLLPTLETLTLSTMVNVTDDLLRYVFEKCTLLRELEITRIELLYNIIPPPKISGFLLKSMVNSLPFLKIRFTKFFEFDVVLSSKNFDERLYKIKEGIIIS